MEDIPFLIICIVNRELSTVNYTGDKLAAISFAANLAVEQADVTYQDAYMELFRDGDFLSEDGSIRIYITQAEAA